MNLSLRALLCGAALAACVFIVSGCSNDEDQSCSRDQDCQRGSICADESRLCVAEPCTSLGDCPGSGRTCLQDTLTCSPKECGDVEGTCPADKICFDSGPYRWSCGTQDTPPPNPDMFVGVSDSGMGGAGGAGGAGGGGGAGGMGGSGGMGVPYEGLCQPCSADRECSEVGEGAECTTIGNTGSFCTAACGPEGEACPTGFTCLGMLGQCVPVNYDCTVCPGRECQNGQVCDVSTGQCVMPRGACEACTGNESCADGFTCGQVSNGTFCLQNCGEGQACPADYACADGVCQPSSGQCDACGGSCEAPTAACIEETGMCGECNRQTPCAGGEFCNPQTNICGDSEPCECRTDAQCAACGGRPWCWQDTCVQCLDDVDCPPRSVCNQETNACDSAPCAGVNCQRGSMCDVQQGGRCAPGCNSRNDCANPESMDCNLETGQCFYLDGTCDAAQGGDGVCMPGGSCTANAFTMSTACTCKKANPDEIFSMELIVPCHPGQICFHLPGTPEGNCAAFGM